LVVECHHFGISINSRRGLDGNANQPYLRKRDVAGIMSWTLDARCKFGSRACKNPGGDLTGPAMASSLSWLADPGGFATLSGFAG